MSTEEHRIPEEAGKDEPFVFPAWHNKVPPVFFGIIGPIVTALIIGGVWYYFSPRYTDVGYRPVQPVAYSHKLHAGDLGLDCRYCHTGVEGSTAARVPPTQTCMNCHKQVRTDSVNLLPVRESFAKDEPIKWLRIHKSPDYVYFDHSAHINGGVGCESCHGRIDQMVVVAQAQPLNMGWCLDCHRSPENFLRPKDKVTAMGYTEAMKEEDQLALGNKLKDEYGVNPPLHCSGCHR
ncbi:MAG: cytochrome c3 family protein [Myxococcales bacterium]|nr:cytochrome c3 family protein [Myxococcales bacterium]MCB9544356.1 cytochrome c3 family protein [Myxococcales bacterium]